MNDATIETLFDPEHHRIESARLYSDVMGLRYYKAFQGAVDALKESFVREKGREPGDDELSAITNAAEAQVITLKHQALQAALDYQKAINQLPPIRYILPAFSPLSTHETQQSTAAWVADTFSNTRLDRIIACIEEMTEMVLGAGVPPEIIRRVMEVPIKRFQGVENNVPEEAADVLLGLYALAEVDGFDLHAELDKKMTLNRSRPKLYYALKQAKKRGLGLPQEENSAA